jgi:hypothetical protein
VADAGAGEQTGGGRTGGSDANDRDVSGGEALLAAVADAGEEHLAGVAFGEVEIGQGVGHRH